MASPRGRRSILRSAAGCAARRRPPGWGPAPQRDPRFAPGRGPRKFTASMRLRSWRQRVVARLLMKVGSCARFRPAVLIVLASCAVEPAPDPTPPAGTAAATADQAAADRAADELALRGRADRSQRRGLPGRPPALLRAAPRRPHRPARAVRRRPGPVRHRPAVGVRARTSRVDPGATIAIVDAYDYPNAESDSRPTARRWGCRRARRPAVASGSSNQTGQASPLPNPSPPNDDWSVETALDLDMASAACPKCKLLLIEAEDDQGDGLFIANDAAATMGASGRRRTRGAAPTTARRPATRPTSTTPAVGYFVATGDSGYNRRPTTRRPRRT